jgi:predicted RNA-binding protein YlxR (DUF448 family)
MGRGGRAKDRDEPERRCIVTGDTGPKAGLIRFVAGPDGSVVPDIAGRLPGRGMWLSADRASLLTAIRKNAFSRAARTALSVPADLDATVDRLLADRIAALLGLARKAGQAVAGLEKSKEWLVKGQASVLIQANDGSDREKSRLRPPDGPDRHITCLSAAEMGLAFGRDRVIHAALAAGGLADQIVYESARLCGLRH